MLLQSIYMMIVLWVLRNKDYSVYLILRKIII